LDLYGWLKKKLGLWSRSFEYIQNISEGCHSCLIDLYGIMLTQSKLLYHIYKKNAQHTKMNSHQKNKLFFSLFLSFFNENTCY
jgi:hypothetical protein